MPVRKRAHILTGIQNISISLLFGSQAVVNDGNLLFEVGDVGLEGLDAALEVADEGFSALRLGGKESEVVLVGTEVVSASFENTRVCSRSR